MELIPASHRVAEQAYITLIVRLRVDRHGQPMYGEVRDLDMLIRGRFIDLTTLITIIEACLSPQP